MNETLDRIPIVKIKTELSKIMALMSKGVIVKLDDSYFTSDDNYSLIIMTDKFTSDAEGNFGLKRNEQWYLFKSKKSFNILLPPGKDKNFVNKMIKKSDVLKTGKFIKESKYFK